MTILKLILLSPPKSPRIPLSHSGFYSSFSWFCILPSLLLSTAIVVQSTILSCWCAFIQCRAPCCHAPHVIKNVGTLSMGKSESDDQVKKLNYIALSALMSELPVIHNNNNNYLYCYKMLTLVSHPSLIQFIVHYLSNFFEHSLFLVFVPLLPLNSSSYPSQPTPCHLLTLSIPSDIAYQSHMSNL